MSGWCPTPEVIRRTSDFYIPRGLSLLDCLPMRPMRTFACVTICVTFVLFVLVWLLVDLVDRGIIKMVPAAQVAPLDLASLMIAAAALVVTGVGIVLAIGAFFGFDAMKSAAIEAAEAAGREAGGEAGATAGAREAVAARQISDPEPEEQGDEYAIAQPQE